MKKDLSIIAALVVVILSGAILFRGYYASPAPNGSNNSGTPVKPSEGTVQLRLGESAVVGNLGLTPVSIVEDSRCAEGVQCVWAGTVKVRTEISSGLGVANQVLELGKSITTEAEEVTLVSVEPNQKQGQTIKPADYIFTIKVTKRTQVDVNQPTPALGKCYVGGCSGQICSDQPDAVSTCEYREAYACYKTAKCERQSNGQCGWTETAALRMCLNQAN